ncbi:TRAP transporter large permease [Kushneria phosphatilytica]|uniref:TRAP transporter large permease protein n=1 Tax=Kushneria phosphatilytica TaxID=657387 RepID=A0A1S1NRS9_9GAMM|nr:TRAP transporter large permease subunit [Kushneria phosphatilytica]OHV08714.1 C4-dicarboxylate ABC transporter [Kushneria phosphatilytica]QEL12434.1 TRAP transporter large permease subunit [Kushneria phosphatilytica]
MGIELLSVWMVVALFALLLIGIPVPFALASSGIVFGIVGFGPALFGLLPLRVFGVVTNYTLLAIPLFVFMGVMLEKSRLAERMLEVIGHVAGQRPGGMAMAIVIVGVLMGASTGIVAATVVTVGLISLPTLLARHYSKSLACGTICAAGTLGQIIPPSLVLIVLSDISGESVGTLFAGALIPGLLLSGLYVLYLVAMAWRRPERMPPIDAEERAGVSTGTLMLDLVKVVAPPLALIVLVLGSIIGGIAAPTEAASMGAIGAILLVACTGRLNLSVMSETVISTFKITGMTMFVLIAAQVFSLAFRGLGGDRLIDSLFEFLPGGVWGGIIFMMALIFLLGFFLDWIEISYIVLPLLLPYFQAQGTDLAWLCILVAMNLQTSFLTPPFGWSLFYLKGVAPPEISTRDIYAGVLPYIGIQFLALVLLCLFPALVTWLPNAIGW